MTIFDLIAKQNNLEKIKENVYVNKDGIRFVATRLGIVPAIQMGFHEEKLILNARILQLQKENKKLFEEMESMSIKQMKNAEKYEILKTKEKPAKKEKSEHEVILFLENKIKELRAKTRTLNKKMHFIKEFLRKSNGLNIDYKEVSNTIFDKKFYESELKNNALEIEELLIENEKLKTQLTNKNEINS